MKTSRNYGKSKVTIYVVLRALVVLTMVRQVIMHNWNNVFMCVLTLFLFLIPAFIEKQLKIEFPNALETIIFLFIFAAEILGEINNFYGIVPNWDTMLHTINGFLCAAIGFSLIDILNQSEMFHISLSPLFVALVAFCFSMTVGVLWEFFEFGMDHFFYMDTQKDTIVRDISSVALEPDGKNKAVIIKNIEKTEIYSVNKNGEIEVTTIENGYLDLGINDTMKDLFVNFIGAVVFSIIGLLYIRNRDKYKFISNFIPIMQKEEE